MPDTSARQIVTRCFLFEAHPSTIAGLLFAGDAIEFARMEGDVVSIANPFALPAADRAKTALVSQDFFYALVRSGASVDDFFARVRRRVDKIVFYDTNDRFALSFGPEALRHADIVIKFQGVYKDRDLYQYRVGALYAGEHWLDRSGGPLAQKYAAADLDKLRPSFPMFFANVPEVRIRRRRLWRGNAASLAYAGAERAIDVGLRAASRLIRPTRDVHHVGALSHAARFRAAVMLADEGIDGINIITSVPDVISGTGSDTDSFPWIGPTAKAMRDDFSDGLQRRGLLSATRIPRHEFLLGMRRHRCILATCGYGELTHRHAEGWQAGRAVISQDLRAAEMLYPFNDGENVVICRPDLGDLPGILRAIRSGEIDWRAIGQRGQETWEQWCRDWRQLFKTSFEDVVA